MEIVIGLPFVIAGVAFLRLGYLKGWKGLLRAELSLRVPRSALLALLGLLGFELLVGAAMFAGLIDRTVARAALSPVWLSLAVSMICGWLLALNWGIKASEAE